jgi:hypothetical protein
MSHLLCVHRNSIYDVHSGMSMSMSLGSGLHNSDPAAVAATAVAAGMEFDPYNQLAVAAAAAAANTTAGAAASTTSSGLSALSGLSGLSAAFGLSSSPLSVTNGLANGFNGCGEAGSSSSSSLPFANMYNYTQV